MLKLIKLLTGGMEKKFRLYTIISPLFMLGEVLMETTIPLVMARIVDIGIQSKDSSYVLRFGALMVAMAMFSLFCGSMCGRISSLAAFGFSKNLRRKLFAKVQGFSFEEMDLFGTGSLVTRLTTDVTTLQNMYQNLIRTAVRSPVMLISGTVMACTINIKLACIFFIAIPVLGISVITIMHIVYPRFAKMFEKYDNLNKMVQENLIGIRVVKAFVRKEYETEHFTRVAEDLRDTQVKAEKIVVLNLPIMQLTVYLCIIFALWFGGHFVISGTMQTGGLISFISYVTQILMSLMMLGRLFVMFIMSRASTNRIKEILQVECSQKTAVSQSKMSFPSAGQAKKDNSIVFEKVCFAYDKNPDHYVLNDISVKIPSGATVGILGGTGSSKSTLVQMIPRLYDIQKGSLKVGNTDIFDWNLEELRAKIGVVLQKNVLFTGTIEENLRWGKQNATQEELENACRAADAHNFVSSFPNGYKTKLEQGGVNLSGGQKQRLCIARAILKNPDILILDDSTSAVDTSTDLRIRNALKQLLPETTKIIIAQRIASVQTSDFIIVMDKGRINATGTHEELLKSNKIYQEIYESQMSAQ